MTYRVLAPRQDDPDGEERHLGAVAHRNLFPDQVLPIREELPHISHLLRWYPHLRDATHSQHRGHALDVDLVRMAAAAVALELQRVGRAGSALSGLRHAA